MKKSIVFIVIFLFAGLTSLVAQSFPINPIPSYNVPLVPNFNGFKEAKKHVVVPLREKRDMEVEISSSSTSVLTVFATVWAVKDNGSVISGPFTVVPGEPISIPIDNGQWGVVITSTFNITASVWIE